MRHHNCKIDPGGYAAATPSVTGAWAAIEEWLARHAPASAARLAAPATPAEIAAGEQALGLSFPAELVESLRRHNGQRDSFRLLPAAPPSSVAVIVDHREICMEIAAEQDGFAPDPVTGEPWWHELWIPFAVVDGDAQVIDLRPGAGCGRLGWAIHNVGGEFDHGWSSLGAYLTAVAEALRNGGHVDSWYPYLTVEGQLWWGPSGKPLRPAPPA